MTRLIFGIYSGKRLPNNRRTTGVLMSTLHVRSTAPAFADRPTGAAMTAHIAEHAAGSLLRVCPECAGPLVRNSACVNCAHCGWGRCA